MNLILAEQALLIALDDTRGRDTSQWGSDVGLAGALLLDLARLELLGVDTQGKVVAVDGAEPRPRAGSRRISGDPRII